MPIQKNMEIPKGAKKVFSGIIFNVYQWQQKMYDDSYKTFEMVSRGQSVDIIATVKDKIIMLVEEQPVKPRFFSIPGGRVEKNETSLAAAGRELLDETGYRASEIILLTESFGRSKLYHHISIFIARDCKKIAKPNIDGGEKIEFTLVSFDKFLQFVKEEKFSVPVELKFMMYEALLDKNKKQELKKKIFG